MKSHPASFNHKPQLAREARRALRQEVICAKNWRYFALSHRGELDLLAISRTGNGVFYALQGDKLVIAIT
ncbi:hypothetical protein [Escherichia coli]|uniref:hypothetical protein n=1 Tax=Escherichia coli TaxID=562 RepID=UPI00259CFD4E|nr:hypothetical protein [Escherichia coli]MDM4882625.1 hypothetical protein [Escherichia coli]